MREKLRIILFPDNSNTSDNITTTGFTFSTTDKIFINKTDDFYHVNYQFTDYLKLDMVKFAKALSGMFDKNMPGVIFDLTVVCEIEKLKRVVELQRAFLAYSNNISVINPSFKIPNINFSSDEDMYNVADDLEDLDDDDEDDYVDPDDINDTVDTINQILGMGGYRDNENDSPFGVYNNHHKDKKGNNNKKTYSSSRVLKEAKRAKRDVKHHNIIIGSREAMDRDEKIIKAFLKDFIPGDSNWIKDYRKTILKRWLNQFTVTKKMAKKIAKRNEEIMAATNGKNGKNLSADRVSKVTRNIIKRYNSFYDTSK